MFSNAYRFSKILHDVIGTSGGHTIVCLGAVIFSRISVFVSDKTSPPRYVKTWGSSVAHSPYPRSKQMTSACREHSARDRATAHGGVRELEGVSPISMGIGDWSQRWASERKDTVRLCSSSFCLLPFS